MCAREKVCLCICSRALMYMCVLIEERDCAYAFVFVYSVCEDVPNTFLAKISAGMWMLDTISSFAMHVPCVYVRVCVCVCVCVACVCAFGVSVCAECGCATNKSNFVCHAFALRVCV